MLTRPTGEAPLDGPEPMNGTSPINPRQRRRRVLIYWLDRMVRSRHQLVERLALVFHDWWATRRDGVSTNAEMLDQTNIFRAHGLGSFRAMARAITADPAMLQFLDGMSNRRGAVNENYGRELMELFTLGADRGAYTETDVREIAKSLSGWTATYSNGWTNWRWDEQGRWDFSTRPCSASPAASPGRTRSSSCSPTRCTRPSSSASSGATSSRRRRTPRRRPRSRSTTSRTAADPAGARGDPVLAAVLRGRRRWSSRRSC